MSWEIQELGHKKGQWGEAIKGRVATWNGTTYWK